MKLSALFHSIGLTDLKKDVEISFITDDSRKCRENTLFVCHEGAERFIEEAKKNGACCVLSSSGAFESCRTADTREAYSTLCRCFFGFPERGLRLIGVTGTNGKTTTASMIAYILSLSGRKTGLISTVFNSIEDEKTEAQMTTPDCFETAKMLRELSDRGGEFCVIEASSQGLVQKRLSGLCFETAVFTNLTEDHLDYHKTLENYKEAKKILFRNCKTAVLNFDDPYYSEFSACTSGRVLSYSVKSDDAFFTAKNISVTEDRIDYVLVSNSLIHRVRLNLQGEFNVENSLAAIITALECGVSLEESANALKNFSFVKGRMEILDTDTPFRVIIDYAHTPDSLKRVLLSLRRFCKGRLIVLFGCGGNREKEKRPVMGQIATTLADIVFVTTDNPRNEDPADIICDILSGTGTGGASLFVRESREDAIALALKTAKEGDVLLLCGKGHETYQLIGNNKVPFDEREMVKKLLSNGQKNAE